jgi:hypothetical protein
MPQLNISDAPYAHMGRKSSVELLIQVLRQFQMLLQMRQLLAAKAFRSALSPPFE